MAADAQQRQREQAQADQEALDREAERQAQIIEAQGKAEAERIRAQQEADAAAREEARNDAEHAHKIEKEKRELALKEAADMRAADDHAGKLEERRMKSEIHAADLKKREVETAAAEGGANASSKVASTADTLLEAVKEIKRPRKIKKTGNGEWAVE
jgi:colicin import membrane protein